jgi:hypothetical protein
LHDRREGIVTELDGKRQRQALTAAERAIRALGDGIADRAVRSADKAAELDQLGVFAGLPEAVGVAAGEIEDAGAVSASGWDGVAGAVGPGPLRFLVDELRR